MSRFNSPETDALLDEMVDLRLSSDSRPNKGSASASAGSAGASSSKAVLAALKALQDKIRRLEAEKTQYTDEISSLRNQLKSQEIESDHVRQRDSLLTQRNMQEYKASNERLVLEKSDLEEHLRKLEDKSKEQAKTNLSLNERIAQLEQERESTNILVRELETSQKAAESHATRTQYREKGE
jgi:chromosome segregation ATPase